MLATAAGTVNDPDVVMGSFVFAIILQGSTISSKKGIKQFLDLK
jgi:hypothetical protein